MKSKHLVRAALLSALCLPAVVQGQSLEAIKRMSLTELSELQVTSVFKRPESLSRTPAAVFVITREEIRRSGSVSLAEVLRLAPNLQVARLDASSHAISARGFNTIQASNKLLVLVDGRSIYTPLHAGVFWDQHQIPLPLIERIEVISGPGGTLWGANAVNGVINVITQSAWDTRGGELVGRAGGTDRSLFGRHSSQLGRSGGLQVHGMAFDRGSTLNDDGSDADNAWDGVQGGLRTDWRLGRSELTVEADLFRNSFAGGDIEGGNVRSRWTHQSDAGSATQAQVYFDSVERDVDAVSDVLESIDVALQQSFTLGDRHRLVWGAGHRVTRDEFVNGLNAFVLDPERDTVRLSNAFVQDTIATSANTSLTVGFKVEDSSYSGTELLPSARFGWQVSADALLWTAISRAVRTPARLDRDLEASGLLDPNPHFGSEILVAYELGYRGQPTASTSVSVSAYYHDYDDLRMLVLGSNGRFLQDNAMRGHTYGLEAWADFQVTAWWRLSAGLNLLEKRLDMRPEAFAAVRFQHAGNDPDNQYSLRSSMDLTKGVEIDVHVRAVDGLPDPPVPGYVAVDARIGWQLSQALELSIAGFNLFDAAHAESGALPGRQQLRRSAHAELLWRF